VLGDKEVDSKAESCMKRMKHERAKLVI